MVHTYCVNSDCIIGRHRIADPSTVRPADALTAGVCTTCHAVRWWRHGTELDPWDGALLGFGQAALLETLTAVGAPGECVLVCRAPAGTRLTWLPSRRWFEAAPQLFVAREGRRLLMSSPNPVLTGVMTHRRSRLALLRNPVPV